MEDRTWKIKNRTYGDLTEVKKMEQKTWNMYGFYGRENMEDRKHTEERDIVDRKTWSITGYFREILL